MYEKFLNSLKKFQIDEREKSNHCNVKLSKQPNVFKFNKYIE